MTKKIIFLLMLCSMVLSGSIDENDPLHKRTFYISMSETRNGIVTKKVISDKMYFKNGKLYSDYINDKFGFKWIRYRIHKDSIYMDSTETEVRLLDVRAYATNEDNQTVMITFITVEWDLDGVIKITKNDKLKKYFDVAGREKGGKPKKERKKAKRGSIITIKKEF